MLIRENIFDVLRMAEREEERMARKSARFFGMLQQEFIRVLIQPWFWFAILGCAVLQFVCVFGGGENYQMIFEQGTRSLSLCSPTDSFWQSFLAYVPFCLCAFPFVGSVIRDDRYNHTNMLILRSGCITYALVQTIVTFLGAFLCMTAGGILFLLAGHFGLGLPFYDTEGTYMAGNLVAMRIQTGMQASFYAMAAMVVSYVVKDMQFVTVFPMVLLYFTMYFLNSAATPLPKWLDPKVIYVHGWGMFMGDDTAQCIYAVFFTVMAMFAAVFFLYFILKRQVRQ